MLHKRKIVASEDSLFSRGTALQEKEREKLKEPEMYRVVLHNDDYTTREFVVSVIIAIFHKTASEATRIMLDVHRKGKGTVGVYVYDIAETKARQVKEIAAANEFPLKCTVEKA
jgi:ATP-dependent Clp protease adaptor protein ClpS